MTRRALLTGITGNLGAAMAVRLLRSGCETYAIVRSRHPGVGARRAREALQVLAVGATLGDAEWRRLHVVEVDMVDPAAMQAIRLPAPIDDTWHFASSLKYMPKDHDEIHQANVSGLINTMRLHQRHATSGARFHYISTAYVAGRSLECVPETRIAYSEALTFNNEYERSKLLAENLFLDAVEVGEVDGNIYRPSIVVADPTSGRLVNYNGLYLGLKAWFSLSEYMCSQGRAGDRVRVWIDPATSLNVMPLSPTIDAMVEISGRAPPAGMVFNLTNASPPTLAQVFTIVNRYMDIECVLVGAGDTREQTRTTYEKLVAYSLTYISPYVKQRLAFADGNVRSLLGAPLSVELYPDGLDRVFGSFRRRAVATSPSLSSNVRTGDAHASRADAE